MNDSSLVDAKIKDYLDKNILTEYASKEEILGHIAKSEHNLDFLNEISDDFNDWMLVVCYYASYHGLIVKFVPVINYTSLDYSLYTVLLNVCGLDAEKEKILRVFLSSDKHTLWAVKTIGRFNVLIYLLVRSIDDLQDTTLKLRSLFPKQINHYETLIAYEEYKYIYFTKGLF